jgi:NAD(P)-dependent dehydrogenase (short-subunit alcohol dehydrogenase family)
MSSFLDRIRLNDGVALVIGCGGGGLGTQTSLALAEAGASVVAVDIASDRVAETEQRIQEAGGTCRGFTADAQDPDAIERIVQTAWDEIGPVQYLVNVVGGSKMGDWHRAEEYPLETFDAVMRFNLNTHFLSCRAVASRLIDRDLPGSIVNYSSLAGTFTLPYQLAYGAAKAAVINMTRTMAVEWGPHGIRVNAIAPGGGISTPRVMARQAGPDPTEGPTSWNPLGRNLGPDEVASTALFLVSGLASVITGQTITVDAGVSSRMPSGGLDRWAPYLESSK